MVAMRWTVAVLAGSMASAKERLSGIPLVWKPTTQIGESGAVDLTGIQSTKIQIDALKDGREKSDLIGDNCEKGTPMSVTTSDDVATWSTARLKSLLNQLGLNVVESDGDVVLRGEIKRFFVSETNTYEGDVGLTIEVVGRDGKTLWSGITGGSADRFGRSYKAENYYETLSDSFLEAVQNLVKNEGFRAALKHK